MKKKEKFPGILYLYIHSKIEQHFRTEEVPEKELRTYLFQWKIPTSLRPLIIKELEVLGLVERINRFVIKIQKSDFNEENLINHYQELGIYH